MSRKLASVQVVESIAPIQGADKIEVVRVLGWECIVAKSDNIKQGDKVVYFEIDSLLPQLPCFSFMEKRKYRVKTIKMRGQISQGLVVTLDVFNLPKDIPVDKDLTEEIGVKKYDPQAWEEEEEIKKDKYNSKNVIHKMLLRFALYRRIVNYFSGKKAKHSWPSFAATKTDEERIQSCLGKVKDCFSNCWIVTEKLDGQSATYFCRKHVTMLGVEYEFGVCSRNVWFKKPCKNNYWEMAEKYNIKEKLQHALMHEFPNAGCIAIQGEICGPNIQGNKYGLKERDLFLFGMFLNNKDMKGSPQKYNIIFLSEWASPLGFKFVPIISPRFIPNLDFKIDNGSRIVDWFVGLSKGISEISMGVNPVTREGLVFQLKINPSTSFKAINNDFLLEHGE